MTTAGSEPAGGIARWEADVVTRDGGTVHVRPIRPSDGQRIRDLVGRASAESIYYRFFTPMATISDKLLDRFVNVDYVDRMAFVALLGPEIVAVGRYERLPATAVDGDQAEVAFLVDDAHQGRGLGTILLEHLAAAGRDAGISRFVADTLPDNSRMLRMFHEAGFDDQRTFADGVVRVGFSIAPTRQSRSLSHRREREAAARSVRKLLAPRSVALIGASRREGSLGREILDRLLGGGFNGPVFPVNPTAAHVASVKAYPAVDAIPDPVDLAVIVVPTDAVIGVVEECARKHVGGLVVVTSGFADRDAEGLAVQRRLVTVARRNGMRMIGPNSMGLINTDPDIRINTTTSPMPPRGRVGFIAQSGGLGVVILDELAHRGLGVSTFVSAGNKADVSGNDLLQYWDEDPATDVILIYIESFGNPRTFGRVARRVSRQKPIVAVKSARSAAGTLAATFSGRPVLSDGTTAEDEAVDALFRRSGVIRTDTLEELLDVAQVLESQPLPAGRRVAIVGNTGGPGVVAADACDGAGLEVVELADETRRRLAAELPWHGSLRNPVDLASDARADAFGIAIGAVLEDPGVDAVLVLSTSPSAAPLEDVARAVTAAAEAAVDKPVIACMVGRRGLVGTGSRRLPSFAFPEAAARALGRVATYAEWRRRPLGTVPDPEGIDVEAARAVVQEWAAGGVDEWLAADAAARLVAAYGIRQGEITAAGAALGLTVGITQDPTFGALVTVNAGTARVAPLTDIDTADMEAEALGEAGRPPAGFRDLLGRVGLLAEQIPEVAELELRLAPGAGGVGTVSARARLRPWQPRPELALRRLR